MTTHAKFGASSSERWMNCPGSLVLIEKAPPPPPSKFAEEGTKAHEVLERLLKVHICDRPDPRLISEEFPPEMVVHATEAANWIIEKANGRTLICETKVDASAFTCPDQFGTVDAAIIEEFGTLTVIDFKYGAGHAVDPENNSQMIYYALGLSHLYHHNFSDVELVIIQPRAYHPTGETIRTWKCSMEELLSWVPKFKDAVLMAETHSGVLQPGSWCHFCPAAVICPKLKDEAMARAMVVFDDEKQVVTATPEPTDIQVAQLGPVLTACEQLEAWISKVRQHAEHCLSRGEEIDGWKMVEKRGRREWVQPENPLSILAIAQERFGSAALTDPELLSPAQLEKKFGKDGKKFTAEHTIMKSFGTSLVPESDKRPAVRRIEAVFEEIDDKTGE